MKVEFKDYSLLHIINKKSGLEDLNADSRIQIWYLVEYFSESKSTPDPNYRFAVGHVGISLTEENLAH